MDKNIVLHIHIIPKKEALKPNINRGAQVAQRVV